MLETRLYVYPASQARDGKVAKQHSPSISYPFGTAIERSASKGSKKLFYDARKKGQIRLTPHSAKKEKMSELKLGSDELINRYWNGKIQSAEQNINMMSFKVPDLRKEVDLILKNYVNTQSRNELLTEATADANAKNLDVLTALAELPETIKMFIDLSRSLRHPLKTLKRLDLASKKPIKQVGYKEVWIKTRKGRRLVKRKTYTTKYRWEGNLVSLADLSSQAWLTYRYGILPLLYTYEDIQKALKPISDAVSWDTVKRFKKSEHEVADLKVGQISSQFYGGGADILLGADIEIIERVMIRTKMNTNQLKQKRFAFNPALTAWELIPYSFVVDWFVQIGDFITALAPTCYELRGITYSKTIRVRAKLYPGPYLQNAVSRNGSSHLIGNKYTVDVSYELDQYVREVVSDNVMNYVTIPTGAGLNLKRSVDLASLSFQWTKDFLPALNTNLLKRKSGKS